MSESQKRPKIVCLCGSTRFMDAFQKANLEETLAGNIVLSVGCNTKDDAGLGLSASVKERLDDLHKQKILLADEILVLNVEGYIGQSTKSEIAFAILTNKGVRFLLPQLGERYLQDNARALGAFAPEFIRRYGL